MIRFSIQNDTSTDTPPDVLLKSAWNRYGNQRLYVSGLVLKDDGNFQKNEYGYYDLLTSKPVSKTNKELTPFQREMIEDAIQIHQVQRRHSKTPLSPDVLKRVQPGQLISTQHKHRGQYKYYVDQYTEQTLVEVGLIDLHDGGKAKVFNDDHKETLTTLGLFLWQEEQTRGNEKHGGSSSEQRSSAHTDLPGSQLKRNFHSSFEIGALGEAYVGGILTALYPNQVFHGVKLPHQGGDIDHLLICSKGVFVINTKTHPQKVVRTLASGEMTVDGRDITKYLSQADTQVAKVRLGVPQWKEIDIRPLIVFAQVDPTSTVHHPYTVTASGLTAMLDSSPSVLSDTQITVLTGQITSLLKEHE